MFELDRRQLLLGGASLVGAAALPVAGAAPALADAQYLETTFSGISGAGNDQLTVANYGYSRAMATWTNGGNVLDQCRLDWAQQGDGDVRYWERVPFQGRALQTHPIDPAVGIFGQTNHGEMYRINVNGFGLVYVSAAEDLVRIQVMGSDGRPHFAEVPRWTAPSEVRGQLETFIDQANTLNSQYANYRTAVGQYILGGAPAVIAATAGLIVAGANPLGLVALIAAVAVAGIAAVSNIRTQTVTYMTTYNAMINTFERLAQAYGFPRVYVPRYNVGTLQVAQVRQQRVPTPQFALFSAPGSN